MILIMSGRYQGEREFAENHFPGKSIFSKNVSETAEEFLQNRFKTNSIIDDTARELSSKILLEKTDIILCHIVGCGVVPIDEKQRFQAELIGRASCLLAKQAAEVWVVRAGIGERIK